MMRALPVLLLIVIGVLACQPHWLATPGQWVDDLTAQAGRWQAEQFGADALFTYTFEIKGLIGVVLVKAVSGKNVRGFNPETFLFGDLIAVSGIDILFLMLLLLAVFGLMLWWYNALVFSSFSPSLARSRRMPIRFGSYLLIVFLALVVNVSIKIVGVLLINALLVL